MFDYVLFCEAGWKARERAKQQRVSYRISNRRRRNDEDGGAPPHGATRRNDIDFAWKNHKKIREREMPLEETVTAHHVLPRVVTCVVKNPTPQTKNSAIAQTLCRTKIPTPTDAFLSSA